MFGVIIYYPLSRASNLNRLLSGTDWEKAKTQTEVRSRSFACLYQNADMNIQVP